MSKNKDAKRKAKQKAKLAQATQQEQARIEHIANAFINRQDCSTMKRSIRQGRSSFKRGTSGLGVYATPTPSQTPCTSAFQPCWVRWLGVFANKLFFLSDVFTKNLRSGEASETGLCMLPLRRATSLSVPRHRRRCLLRDR